MKLSSLDYVWAYGTIILNAGLFCVIEYRFLRALRRYFLALALSGLAVMALINSPHIAYLYWYIKIALLIWQGLVTSQLVALLCPRLPRSAQRIIPTVIAAATIVNGKPGTTWGTEYPSHHMLVYEIICLAFLIIVICFALIFNSVRRFEVVAIGFGMLLAAQSVAALHRLFVGISPLIWNLCWLAGISFIVHAVFTYEPDISLPEISSAGGRK